MPIVIPSKHATRHVVVCQTGQRLDDVAPMFVGKTRYMVIFIAGNFTLEEANAFAIDTFDQADVADRDLYFQNSPWIHTVAFSCETVPVELEHVINNFSTVDFVDSYTFHLLRHLTDRWMGIPAALVVNS